MRSRCLLHNGVIEDNIIEGLIDQQEEHIFYYHTDELRERGLDAIRLDWFQMETVVGPVGKPGKGD